MSDFNKSQFRKDGLAPARIVVHLVRIAARRLNVKMGLLASGKPTVSAGFAIAMTMMTGTDYIPFRVQ